MAADPQEPLEAALPQFTSDESGHWITPEKEFTKYELIWVILEGLICGSWSL